MEKVNKLISALALFMIIIGVFGGFGYCVYIKEYPVAVCMLVAGLATVPAVSKIIKYLSN